MVSQDSATRRAGFAYTLAAAGARRMLAMMVAATAAAFALALAAANATTYVVNTLNDSSGGELIRDSVAWACLATLPPPPSVVSEPSAVAQARRLCDFSGLRLGFDTVRAGSGRLKLHTANYDYAGCDDSCD
jgi:hypothetical protein